MFRIPACSALILRRLYPPCVAVWWLMASPQVFAANYYFDANGPASGSDVVNGASYAWSEALWSTTTDGTAGTIVQPGRHNSYFSAGSDAYASYTLTGATGEIGSIIVQEGNVTIQSLTRIFNGGSVLRTLPGTSLTIQNSPDFYDRTVTFDTAADTTITIAGINSGGVRRAYLSKSGPGLLIFQGTNIGAAGGTIAIHDGEYRIQNSNAVASGNAVVNAGGTLSLANHIAPARALTLNGSGFQHLGALRSHAGNNSWNGLLTLASAATIQAAAGAGLTLNPASGDAITGPYPLVLCGAGDITVSKPVHAVTSVTISGPGTTTFAAAHNYSGPTIVEAGTLRLVESGGLLASTPGVYQIDGILEVSVSGSQTLSNPIHGGSGGVFRKLGPGTLLLTAASPLGGTVAIDSGPLALDPAASLSSAAWIQLASSASLDVTAVPGFTLHAGQTLGGFGGVLGSVTAQAGSSISPGGRGVPGTLSFDSAQSWAGGVAAEFDLAENPAATGDLITIAGNLTLSGSNLIRVRHEALENGTYPLIRTNGGTILGDVPLLQLEGFVPGTHTASIQLNGSANEISLVVSNNPYLPKNLVWTGNGTTNRWDKTTPDTWLSDGTAAPFTDTDPVTFDDSGQTNAVIDLTGGLVPGSVHVASAGTYLFAGSGSIAGPATLTKSGTGTLIIGNSNAFTGGTVVSGGTLEVRAQQALGSGPVTVAAVLALAPSAPLAFANPISGSGTIVHLAGSSRLDSPNSFDGPAIVSGGTLLLGNSGALGQPGAGTTVSTGAMLDLNGQAITGEPLDLAGGILCNSHATPAVWNGSIVVSAPSGVQAAQPLTLGGGLSGSAHLTKSGSATVTLAGNHPLSGPVTVEAGTLDIQGQTGPGIVTIGPDATLTGSGTLGGPATIAGNLAPTDLTCQGPVILQPTSSTTIRIRRSLTTVIHDRLSAPQITFGGTLRVVIDGTPPLQDDIYQVFGFTHGDGGFSTLELPFLSGDLMWDESQIATAGILRVIALPAVSISEQRRRWLLTRLADNPGGVDGFTAAGGFFARGDIETGRSHALNRSRSLLANHRDGAVQVDLFYIWPAIDLAIRHGQYLDAETHANIREVVLTFNQYKDTTTSNLKTLSWVTRFLGGQLYGEAAFDAAVDGGGQPVTNDWRASDPNARATILSHLATVVTNGFGETASRPYLWKNLLPILSLGQLSDDPVIRDRSLLAYEAGLAQCAGYWLRGHLAMPTTRSYPDVLDQYPVTSLGQLWFHFGGELPPLNSDSATMTAMMNPEVSPILELAAASRDEPVYSRSKVGSTYLHARIEREYALFADGPAGPNSGQVYPNGVVWTEADRSRYSHLWVTKPIQDDGTAINISNTHGKESRQFKETVARDALLYVFDIEPPAAGEATPTPYALGYVPGGYRAVVNDAAENGHIFLHYGSVMIALRSEIPFGWNPASGIAFPSGPPRSGDSEFIIDGDTDPSRPPATMVTPLTCNLRFALAIETAAPGDFEGATPTAQLASFRNAILALPGPARTGDATPTAVYTTRRGDSLRLAESSDITTYPVWVNGAPVEHALWPRIGNPWIDQPHDQNLLILRSPGRREAIDFNTWTRTVTTGAVDLTPPVLANVPGNMAITPDHPLPAPGFSVTATDDIDGPLPVVYHPPAGSVFPTGKTTIVTASATDGGMNVARASFAVTVLPYEIPAPSAPWSVGNIGALPVVPGAARQDLANGVVMVSGTGGTSGTGASGDIWNGASEGFTYVFRPWTGDGVLTARLCSFSASDTGAKAGVMFREANTAGARNAITYMIAGGSAFFQTKSATNGNVANSSTTGLGIPRWIRLVRSGNTFTGFHSHDGVQWTQQGAPVTIAMAEADLTAGLAVAPRTGGQMADVIFDKVAFTAIRPNAYEQWRFDRFDAFDNSGAAADGADPDADGVANLAEFVLNGNPRAPDPSIFPKAALTATHVHFTFSRREDSAADTLQYFDVGPDLSNWTTLRITPPTDPGVIISPDANGLQTLTITLPRNRGPADKLFGRLRVSSR